MPYRKKKPDGYRAVILGIIIQLATLTLALVAAAIISCFTENPLSHLGVFSLCAVAVSGLISGAVIRVLSGGITVPLLSALSVALSLFAASVIAKGGADIGTAIAQLILFAASALGAVIFSPRKRHARRT